MILHEIDLRHVGPFRDTVRLGPFSRGLNIVAAPNETGKTTALRGAARAIFDRHTTKGDELKSLQPAGTELAPRIAVDFETARGRFRIEKTFLQSPASILQQRHGDTWETIAESDAADRKVQELLNSSLPGRGGTKPEHWGFLGFLWARQGEAADWPALNDEAVGQKIRARLVRVELDPVIERLREHLTTASADILTSTGRPRTGGPWDLADKELESIESALAAIQRTRLEIEVAQQRHQQATAAVAQLERELTDREASAKTLAEQATAADRLKGELDARQKELTAAREKLTAVSQDIETLAARQQALATARTALATAETAAQTARDQLADLHKKIDATQAQRPDQERKLTDLRAAHARLQSLLKLRQAETQLAALIRQRSAAELSAQAVLDLTERLSRLPALTPAKVAQLQKLTDTVTTLRARVEALGLSIALTPDHDATVRIDGDTTPRQIPIAKGTSETLHSPQALTLDLDGWGRIVIRSGAEEGRNAAEELVTAENHLRDAFEQADVLSLESARAALASRNALEIEIKAARATHQQHLGESKSLDSLREAVAAAQRRVETLAQSLDPTPEETALDPSALETEEARIATAIPSEAKRLAEIDADLARLRAAERTAVEASQASTAAAAARATDLRTLETQIAELTARYPDSIETAKTQAGETFVQAEARLHATRSQLPPDFEQLPERNRRAAVALQEIRNALETARRERDSSHGALESLGGQGIYSRETELEEKKAEIQLRRDAARDRGWATRITLDLIAHRKQAATRAVLTPLEDRLSAAFATLTGHPDRRVFLDENLQISGLGRTREAAHPFDGLSQGAKEQLLLCLRLAVAQELSSDEPQILILDDVLVNTDPVRQDRVLDLLGTEATRLQILILTCHPDRYRGEGATVSFTPLAT